MNRILSIGVYDANSAVMNRKVRVCNLISFTTLVLLTLFGPLFFYFLHPIDLLIYISFYLSAILSFFLVKKSKYMLAFSINICMAYIYFIWGTLAYGWSANLQYYLLAMCMVVVIFFDSKVVIKSFLAFSIACFFSLLFIMRDRQGLIDMPLDVDSIKESVGYANLFSLFIIVSILILFFKNQNLNYQDEITEASRVIEEKNKEMIDSINYAQRIQSGLLPSKTEFQNLFPNSFLYFRPKDIVSGDFYWFHKTNTEIYLACGDCTGHGVPGALMSVLGINLLSDIVESNKATETDEILNQLRNGIIKSLNKETNSGDYKDGMDISIVKINKEKMTCDYSGANNSIYQISNGSLIEHKATKQPVGLSPDPKPFGKTSIALNKQDYIILFTDGFADQFGGDSNKKYMYKPFKELLKQLISAKNIDVEHALDDEFTNWRTSVEQVDDICIVGIKI
jgi:sigma-B regulation protein RsbU (phosphoserine phosphatase)